MSPQVNHRAVSRVLAGTDSYDSLGEREQALVRERWASRINELRTELDYEANFDAAGESFSEADENGTVVVHPARD